MTGYVWALAALVGVVVYLLYRNGLAVTKSISAVLFVFRPGREGDRVSLDSCTGWVRHRGRFRETRTYAFDLDARLSRGDAEVSLLDEKKRTLLKLDRRTPSGEAALDGKRRYDVRWSFQNAAGTCELRWR